MMHFNYVRFTDENADPFKVLVGVRCMLNGRCICQIARFMQRPLCGLDVNLMVAEADAIEDEVRDTVDLMDPEVLL